MKKRWILLAIVALLLAWAFTERRMVFMRTMAMAGGGYVPELMEKSDEGPNARWLDNYFTVEIIAPGTIAIGEPRYPYQNFSYLIIGNDRALLFDGGPGIRDIGAVARSLTRKPITFLPSHLRRATAFLPPDRQSAER